MGQFSFDEFQRSQERRSQTTTAQAQPSGPRVGFFALKNDGDEAIVRIMHDSTADFDMCAVHNVDIGNGRKRNVNCIRTPKEPIDNCPLCAANVPVYTKIFIHLIEYVRDDQGQIQALPRVFERPASYANTLKQLLDEYGPLSDNIFKIKRSGAPKSRDTRYNIMYASPAVYRPDLYPKKPELFEGYKAVGNAVVDKTADELMDLCYTNGFIKSADPDMEPIVDMQYKTAAPVSQTIIEPRQYQPQPAAPVMQQEPRQYQAEVQPQVAPSEQMPWDNKPVRRTVNYTAQEANTFTPARRY